MNRFFYGFIALLFLFLSIYPFSNVFADNDLVITGTPIPVQGDITDDQLKDIIVAGITADLVSQGYSIDLSASDGDWDNFKNAILDYIFNSAASGSGFWGEIYNSALYHNLIDENFTIWYPDNSDGSILPGISKRSIYRNLSENLINNFLDSRSDSSDNSPTPTSFPDQNIGTILDEINSTVFASGNGGTFDVGCGGTIIGITVPYGSVACNFNQFYFSNNSYQFFSLLTNYQSVYINYFPSNQTYNIFCDDYIGMTPKMDNINYKSFLNCRSNTEFPLTCTESQNISTFYMADNGSNFGSFSTLLNALNFIKSHWHFVYIYLDNELLSYPEYIQQLPTVVINPGYVLQGTDYPMQYNFPEPPSFDYQRMIDIIKHALLQYGVIQWEDIADVFVDVNGQTAVAILEIHRNDYDVMYDEQYPGIALPNRFNTHLLDTSHQYLSPVVQTVEETTGILPGEIKGALAIGMILTIFACLIHRLLE